jgi:hypothetical protein
MNLAIRQLGFDPQALMGRLKAVGLVRVERAGRRDPRVVAASARYEARQKGLTGAGIERKTVVRPELKGLTGRAYHRAYGKLRRQEWKRKEPDTFQPQIKPDERR